MTPDPEHGGMLTDRSHWESYHAQAHATRPKLPSRLPISTNNCLSLLDREGLAGKSVLEIGYAPGKILAWCASRGAVTTGLDYTKHGTEAAVKLFATLGLPGSHITADIFSDHGLTSGFDLVYSIGVIEHFTDPSLIIGRHLDCCKPGGKALIMLPNYGGIYARMQRRIDPANLAVHNLSIMRPEGLDQYLPPHASEGHRYRRAGRPHLELVSLERRIGRVGRYVKFVGNLAGWLFPMHCGPLSPMWVLEVRRRAS